MLSQLCNTRGISGYESNVINFLHNNLDSSKLDSIRVDNIGNLICFRKGTNSKRRILINAHIDEVGFQIINKIEENKYRIKCIGNIKTWNAIQERVSSYNNLGIIYAINEENLKPYNYDNLYLKVLYEKNVKIGDVFTFVENFYESDDYIIGKALDNRVSCYCLMELINKNIKTKDDVFYVFTVQEELGMRGARVAKSLIKPEVCINLDVSPECDMNSLKMSEGVGIKVSDSVAISNLSCVEQIINIASKNNINYQLEVSDCGTTELIISNEFDSGYKDVGISIPCSHIHSANTIIHKNDLMECQKLLSKIVENL